MTLRVLTIVGPTATGKTRLGVEVAHRLGSEILSADSRQVYRGLDIGTGKDLDEYERVDPPVPYHLIDIVDPDEVYTVFDYQRDCFRVLCAKAADRRFGSGRVPLVMVGGSGLYVEAIVRGYAIADVSPDPVLRAELANVEPHHLRTILQRDDPELAARTDLSSTRRVIRAIEIARSSRQPGRSRILHAGVEIEWLVFGVHVDREVLRQRIRERLDRRIAQGMVDEVRALLDRGLNHERLAQLGLEYRELGAHLAGRKSLARAIKDLDVAIGRFAKRQQTWFRGMERRGVPIHWITAVDVDQVLAASGV